MVSTTPGEGVKYDKGKAQYSLLAPELERWARVSCPSSDGFADIPATMLPDVDGSLRLDWVWSELCYRWGNADSFLHGVVKVLTHGAGKYGADNWQNVERVRYYNAYRRHLRRGWFAGVPPYDKDTGLHHLLHAGACVLIMKGLDMLASDGERDNPEAAAAARCWDEAFRGAPVEIKPEPNALDGAMDELGFSTGASASEEASACRLSSTPPHEPSDTPDTAPHSIHSPPSTAVQSPAPPPDASPPARTSSQILPPAPPPEQPHGPPSTPAHSPVPRIPGS